ncbi:MAG: ribose 5-phosphate isomerase B [Candidatus Solibacter usitatus]|nr:ribose 5-phosphate isomerase B [Candidatus Solibacter usitatus]
MKIALGADHAGFALKEQLRAMLTEKGHEVADFGAAGPESTDYPDYAAAVGRSVAGGECERGVLVCSTGVGMSMAANKVPGIRAALAFNADEVEYTRRHNDANVLTMGAKYLSVEEAGALIDVFLATAFEGGRHQRRVDKIMSIEKEGKQG